MNLCCIFYIFLYVFLCFLCICFCFLKRYFLLSAFCEENFVPEEAKQARGATAQIPTSSDLSRSFNKVWGKIIPQNKKRPSDRKDAHALYHLTYLTICAYFYVWLTARLTWFQGRSSEVIFTQGVLSIGSHQMPTLWGIFPMATVFVIAFTLKLYNIF